MVMDVENEVLRGAPRLTEPLWCWPREALAAGNSCVRGNTRRRLCRSREFDRVEGEQQLAPLPAWLIERNLARVFESVNGGGRELCDSADLFEIHQLQCVDGHGRSSSNPSSSSAPARHNSQQGRFFRLWNSEGANF